MAAGNVLVHSYYTGKGTDGTVFEHLDTLMQKEKIAPEGHKVFIMQSASDNDKACLKLLVAMKGTEGLPMYQHVFGDMESKFTLGHKSSLEAMTPKKGADLESRVVAYEEMTAFLQSEPNVHQCDEAGRVMDYCYMRKAFCPVLGMWKRNGEEGSAAKHAKQQPGLRCIVAGSCCEDFARYGNKLGPSGPKMKAWVMFRHDVETIRPDIVIFENADTCPESFYMDQLGHLFQFMSVIVSLVVMGWPARRPRRYTFGWDANKFTFDGTPEEFLDVFAARPVMDGDVFFQATAQERQDFMRKLAQRRGMHYPGQTTLDLASILSVSENNRYEAFLAQAPSNCSLQGVCLADLDQNIGFTPLGPFVPTLVKHFKIVNLKTAELMLPREALAVQGEPVFGTTGCKDFPCFMWEAARIAQLSDAAICKLAGNAFHIGNFGPFVLYCLSSLVSK